MNRNTKSVRESVRVKTHLDDDVMSKVRNTDQLEKGLSVGSKNRLKGFQSNLMVSRGVKSPGFDEKLGDMLKKYVWDYFHYDRCLDYLNRVTDEDGFKFSRDLKIYSTCSEAFRKFSQNDYSSFRWNKNYRKSLEEWTEIFSHYKLKPLSYKSDDDIRQSLPKEDTHSGYQYIISGNKKKGDNMEGAFKTYSVLEESAIAKGSFGRPMMIGFRTQASGEFTDEGEETGTCKHKLRVVSMVDLFHIIAEVKFANPFQKLFSSMECYAGGKDFNEISIILSNWRSNSQKFISIDYSSYDQTISSWLIEDAFDVIRSAFTMNDQESALFDVIVHDFIHKDFLVGEGLIHSDKGVPSGSMFTQLIDSLVNLIVIGTYFHSIGQECNMMAMGDDNIIFCNSSVMLDEMASYIRKNFGLEVKTDDKSNEGSTQKDPKFLSAYWTNRGRWRHPNLLFSRMLFPERKRDYNDIVGPEHVLYAFILTYPKGMAEMVNIPRFQEDYPNLTKRYVENVVDSRYLPGALAYIKEYT